MTNETKTIIVSFSAGLVALVACIAFGLGIVILSASVIQSSAKPSGNPAPTRPWLGEPAATPWRPRVGNSETKEAQLEKQFGPVDRSAASEPKNCGFIRSRRTAMQQYRRPVTTTNRYVSSYTTRSVYYSTPSYTVVRQPVYYPIQPTLPVYIAPKPIQNLHPEIDLSSDYNGTVALKDSIFDCPDGLCPLRNAVKK